jgi:gluconolactonase
MTNFTELATELAFPEGPVLMPDGSVVVTEIGRGCLTRISQSGDKSHLADTGGGPNGAAFGKDGLLYICNNGGFAWETNEAGLRPAGKSTTNTGGLIQVVDPDRGSVEVLYTHCGDISLAAPNDLVLDAFGGFYFTDHGHKQGRTLDLGAVFYARCDGNSITQVAFPLIGPNGIGLSPDGTNLYVAETSSGRIWEYPIHAPGELGYAAWSSPTGGNLVAGLPGFQRYDSLAIEAIGNIAVATLRNGGINIISPDGVLVERIEMPDPYTTNICFGGTDYKTAFITLSSSGRLVSMPWARPGLAMNELNFIGDPQ